MDPITFSVVKIFILATVSFVVAFALTPVMTHYLYKYKLGKSIRTSDKAPVFYEHHKQKSGTPTMGGIMIWFTVALLAFLISLLSQMGIDIFTKFSFLTRAETLLPLGALLAAAFVGLLDDYLNIRGIGPHGGGLRVKHKLLIYTLIALIGALWFYFKLDWDVLYIPFLGNFEIGIWYIPIFIFVIVATTFSMNEADGLDGLAGGMIAVNFLTLGAIAFMQGKFDLASFCAVIVGALMAFLWFNIPPARFFMGDTGSMGLGITLGIVAMLTNTAFLLPIIGIVFVLESLSVIIQVLSKKFRNKKVFLSAPWHHHLEAKGWPEYKIVMRLWVITTLFSLLGFIIYILDKNV
ncbi:phospho-N-acetylmuramoyl-pentapeptide-transferase [Patescibacteria group bacterium]|nr:phospho-N-acetylmuramoyl-pentapeptide-transferase [Patescibacteria group bacterium]